MVLAKYVIVCILSVATDLLLLGRHSRNRVHRIGDATSKDLQRTPRRLGLIHLVATARVRQFIHLGWGPANQPMVVVTSSRPPMTGL